MAVTNSSVTKIQQVLQSLNSDSHIVEFPGSTRTAQEAADQIGCQLGQIVKSLIFQGQISGKAVMVLTSGVNRVDEKKIGAYVGEPIGRAKPDFVHEITGYAIGGVPPLALANPIQMFIDEDLLQYQTIWAAAGAPNAVFEIVSSVLAEVTHARVVCVKPG
jgi:prolyl-tRNA editing enzyme YbaK/EbsC (Cys-tRNA(Pro) deacylase)